MREMGLRVQTKHGAEKLPEDMRTVLINQSKLRRKRLLKGDSLTEVCNF